MKKVFILMIIAALSGVFSGCETATGVTRDIANTAKNIRDIFGAGRDIGNMSK